MAMQDGSCWSKLSEPESHQCSSLAALSPDMLPIERLWNELGRRVRHRQTTRGTLQKLRDSLEHEWKNKPLSNDLIGSMRQRCKTFVTARGGHTRY